MRFAGNKIFVVLASVLVGANAFGAVELGIEVLESPRAADPGLGAVQFTFSKYRSGTADGSSLRIHPTAAGNLTLVNIYAPAEINRQLRTNLVNRSTRRKREMFFKCCGSSSVASRFSGRIEPAGVVASWTEDVTQFKGEPSQYLLY
jgi:hypothetical protein